MGVYGLWFQADTNTDWLVIQLMTSAFYNTAYPRIIGTASALIADGSSLDERSGFLHGLRAWVHDAAVHVSCPCSTLLFLDSELELTLVTAVCTCFLMNS